MLREYIRTIEIRREKKRKRKPARQDVRGSSLALQRWCGIRERERERERETETETETGRERERERDSIMHELSVENNLYFRLIQFSLLLFSLSFASILLEVVLSKRKN